MALKRASHQAPEEKIIQPAKVAAAVRLTKGTKSCISRSAAVCRLETRVGRRSIRLRIRSMVRPWPSSGRMVKFPSRDHVPAMTRSPTPLLTGAGSPVRVVSRT